MGGPGFNLDPVQGSNAVGGSCAPHALLARRRRSIGSRPKQRCAGRAKPPLRGGVRRDQLSMPAVGGHRSGILLSGDWENFLRPRAPPTALLPKRSGSADGPKGTFYTNAPTGPAGAGRDNWLAGPALWRVLAGSTGSAGSVDWHGTPGQVMPTHCAPAGACVPYAWRVLWHGIRETLPRRACRGRCGAQSMAGRRVLATPKIARQWLPAVGSGSSGGPVGIAQGYRQQRPPQHRAGAMTQPR